MIAFISLQIKDIINMKGCSLDGCILFLLLFNFFLSGLELKGLKNKFRFTLP